MIRGQAVTWDAALNLVAERFAAAAAENGPDSVAFYVSGQCVTEDYYVANKLMKGFIGSGNIDTNSRLCMASTVAGHVRAFGEDVVPGVYEDFEQADLVVLAGSNAAWCHPVLNQRLLAARTANGTRIVVLDPRRTATAEVADLHLRLAAGSDVALFSGLLAYLDRAGAIDRIWVGRHASGLDAALAAAMTDLEEIAAICGIDPEALETFYDWFARTERVVTAYSQGINQSSSGTDKVNAIINCHLATGRIGRPGMGPFSLTGQPNAMGGREVGGLANQLAAHLAFDRPEHHALLQRFWNSPRLATKPGLKAVDLFDAVLDGRIKALWIVATNPAVSMPRAGRIREALARCAFVVVSDCWPTDTTSFAHVLLPAAGWGERSGTVTNSERRISRQRPFRAPPGEARPDWWMFAEVARRMGFGWAFAWSGPAAVFREHAALSGFENGGSRLFDISALAEMDDRAYDAMAPVRWPLLVHGAGEAGRLFAHGGFPTSDGRARMISTPYRGRSDAAAGLLLNTGRIRDQWHTMTRTGLVPALMTHTAEPMLAIHPADADAHGIAPGDLVQISQGTEQALLRADVTHAQRRGEVFAPMHWTDSFASAAPVGRVVDGPCDPISGQPEMKATPVRIARAQVHFHGLLLRRHAGPLSSSACHWVRIVAERGQLYRLAGLYPMPAGKQMEELSASLLDAPSGAEWLEVSDPRRGMLRIAVVLDDRLTACLFLACDPASLPAEAAMLPLLGAIVPNTARLRLLAGRPHDAAAEEGPSICACFGVTRGAVRHAVVTNRLQGVREIGALLGAGTNCGSCVPELEEILRDVRTPAG
jgi:assimilatory nitrate reductase catalytic subunit